MWVDLFDLTLLVLEDWDLEVKNSRNLVLSFNFLFGNGGFFKLLFKGVPIGFVIELKELAEDISRFLLILEEFERGLFDRSIDLAGLISL